MKKYERCVLDVKKKIDNGEIKKTYSKGGKRIKTNPFAVCNKLK